MKPRRKAGLDCRYRASRGLFPRDSDTSKPPASSLSSLFPLSLQVFNSTIDGGDQFMVPLALGPSLFGSQHVGELGQQVAFFLPNEHGVNFSSVSTNGCRARPPVRQASGVGGKKVVDRLSTKAKAEGGKSMTCSAQPSPTS